MGRVRRVAVIVTATASLGLACLFVALWVYRRGDTVLPEPTGTFGVARTTLEWHNPSAAPQTFSPEAPSAELVVWIWYPTDKNPTAPTLDYLPSQWLVLARRTNPFPFSLLTRDLSRVRGHSIRGGVSSKQPRYPVVILRSGLGAKTLDYTTLAEDLASHGYVVVGFDAPYRTTAVVFADGRVVARPAADNPEMSSGLAAQNALTARLLAGWVADTRFVLDQLSRLDAADSTGLLEKRLDLNRVGVVGHSLGGATAAQVCHDDPRCSAGIDLDGAPRGSGRQHRTRTAVHVSPE
jgi:predicted dienelactone hydrolase